MRSDIDTLDGMLNSYEGKCFNDIRSDLVGGKKLDVSRIVLITEVLDRLCKYTTWRIKLFERDIVSRELEMTKSTDRAAIYAKFSKLGTLISRRCVYYTNRQWDSWRLYKIEKDPAYKCKYEDYEKKVAGLAGLKDELLNRTEWMMFKNEKYRAISRIDFNSYVFSNQFLEFNSEDSDSDVDSDVEAGVIFNMIKKI